MARKILFRRGNKNALPTLSAGEPAFALDTKELYIGTGDGTASVVGSGDMLKSVYDTNNNGKVDDSDKLGGQPPEYYAAEYPVYQGTILSFSAESEKSYIDIPDAPNLIQNRIAKFAVDLVANYDLSEEATESLKYHVHLGFGEDPRVEPTQSEKVYKLDESGTTPMRVFDFAVERYRYIFEYSKRYDAYICINSIQLGNSGGSVMVIDNLNEDKPIRGHALSARQGNFLFVFIDGVARQLSIKLNDKQDAFPERPTLTALTPVGTTVGSSGWTGTGEFNTSASSNNSHDVFSSQIGSGYLRLNLKLAAGEDWKDWSAYYDKDGEEFPFYYSEARGLYDGIIPDEGLTLQQAVDKIRWVYRRKPDIMIYGSLGGIMMVRTTTADGQEQTSYILTTDIGRMWRCGTGDYGDNSDTFAYRMATRGIKLTQLNLPAPLMVKIALTADVEGESSIGASTALRIGQIMSGVNTAPEICGIDNWGA